MLQNVYTTTLTDDRKVEIKLEKIWNFRQLRRTSVCRIRRAKKSGSGCNGFVDFTFQKNPQNRHKTSAIPYALQHRSLFFVTDVHVRYRCTHIRFRVYSACSDNQYTPRYNLKRHDEWQLTPSTPAVPWIAAVQRVQTSAPYWSNAPFLIFDIRALWRSGLSARALECQKLKLVG